MNSKTLKTRITILSMLLCFSLFAQGPPNGQGRGNRGSQQRGQQRGNKPDASEILSKLDLNNDKLIDKDEASKDRRGKLAEDFDLIDSNADSFINLEELKDSLDNRSSKRKKKKIAPEKLIKQVDDNGDGTLNELELAVKKKHQLVKDFKVIDANKDNELDLEELKVFFSKSDKEKNKRKKRKKRK